MFNGNTFYHASIKRIITAYASLFSNIYIERREGDSAKGNKVQTLHIPIAYAPKEKWLVRVDSDPKLENHTYTSLPRMSFELTGYSYDKERKLNRINQITCSNDQGMTFVYSPVPWNLDIKLYILTKTQEDAMQIVEQILPTFNPEYTLSVKMIDEMNIIQDIPVILNTVDISDEYDGEFQKRRFVTHTLDFTLKANFFGGLSPVGGVIEKTIVDVGTKPDMTSFERTHLSEGDVDTGQITRDEWLDNF